MLLSLHIENYVLINSLEIDFSKDLNTITGETGAGKSILLGALQLLLGGKADGSSLKNQSKNCIIEAIFDIKKLSNITKSLLEENDIDFEETLSIRRIITAQGKSKAYINDIPVLLSLLKSLGEQIIDIHSQHQTLLIADNSFQIAVLDAVSSPKILLEEYKTAYNEYLVKKSVLLDLKEREERAKRDEDFLRFQYNQLEEAKLSVGEESDLNDEFNLLNNAQTITEALLYCISTLNDNEESVLPTLSKIGSSIDKVSRYIKDGEALKERIHSSYIELKEVYRDIESISEQIGNDPDRLENISARLDLIHSLELKHKVKDIESLIELKERYKSDLAVIDNFDNDLNEAEKDLNISLKKAKDIAKSISANRRKGATKLESDVINTLQELGMPNSKLIVEIKEEQEINIYGSDSVEFLFSANKGVQCEKISKVASGGEMSRLMLTLKRILSEHGTIPTLIFDEIDAGVSGKVADKMGEIIVDLSHNVQIINITHLPQIAAKGNTHFLVYKEHLENESITNIKCLSPQERIEQIAVMISGSEMTPSAISQAKELLNRYLDGGLL